MTHEPSGLLAGRYEDLGVLGKGGMGEVRRVRDTVLGRTLAMKLVHESLLGNAAGLARFTEEAQATAQLQHPGIIPVHDLGRLDDGRLWFTMLEVRGRTLSSVIREVHDASEPATWTFRRLVNAIASVCQAVGYAHARGVVHRDLKPDNVMVGTAGEVYVLDWGIAKLSGVADDGHEPVRADARSDATRVGRVTGTPVYMSPEQARGQPVDSRSDVYSLGAVLYEALCGSRPYRGDARTVIGLVRAGPPPSVRDHSGASLPDELVAACERAMARDPQVRFPDASALASELEAWLDGARRREQALDLTRRALGGESRADLLRARAEVLRSHAADLLAGLPPWTPTSEKAEGWACEDAAVAAELQAALADLDVDQGLAAALRVSPDLPEAHAARVTRLVARHQQAEDAHDAEGEALAAALLREHTRSLPPTHPVRLQAESWLEGSGALTVLTDPPGAQVRVLRYAKRERRLVAEPFAELGPTPIIAAPLPMGSYLCELSAPGRAVVRYPVAIGREGQWDGVPPEASEPIPVWLPTPGEVPPGCVYVPAGWFAAGDPDAPLGSPRTRRWAEGLFVQRHPVTNAEYVAFLNALVASGRTEEALRHAPRERPATEGELGPLILGFDGRRFSLEPDGDGDPWHPDTPVVQVDYAAARAYAAHVATPEHPFRLLAELEWEKAARGVDGRIYPWGDFHDPTFSCMTLSHRGARGPVPVHAYPLDESPYGVRGMAGNVQTWCLEPFELNVDPLDGTALSELPPTDPDAAVERTLRGGSWFNSEKGCRSANRFRSKARVLNSDRGIRLGYRLSRRS
ncbi:MAG: bifunctional serine/threonine-protein kinase/formylglycine-generating enzyme family protein [Myxococcota bacterium]